ncbi:hypothetical protein ACFTXM_09765 [Streptomyces sp. NPDC056930]|uniref:hypothetical protein n=1 Tax=Streptomyces sp. NPDC056930 TaxID=3345967 RepID=UPI003630A7D8
MPLTDSYGQGVTYPTLTDKPNAQTLGQGIVDNLTPKVVMTFASAVVRGATIKKPVAGMVTWLKDVGRLEVYDGTAWVAFGYGANAWKNVPLASGWTNNGNSQGTFQYRVVNMYGENTIMFRGGISRSSYPATMPPFVTYTLNSSALPTGSRPSSLRSIVVPCSDTSSERITLKLDITTDGWLNLLGTNNQSKPPWIGFNGCFASL